MSLFGQVALITGAGRGIGRAVAERLAGDGMAVGLLARSEAQLDSAREACERAGAEALALPVDVSDPAALTEAIQALEDRLGPADLLVSNAGTGGPEGPLWETGFDAWWTAVRVNLGGAMAAAAAVLPGMVSRGHGRIVHMNSLAATRDSARYGAYAISKAAMLRLGGVLAASLAGTGVVVLDVSPGWVRTDLATSLSVSADLREEDWMPVENIQRLVAAIAAGRLDALTGRLILAAEDWEALANRADEVVKADGRALRLTPAGPGDPWFE